MKLTISQQREAARVIESYQAVTANLRQAVLTRVLGAWDALTSWRDDDIATFVSAAVPQILAGQSHMGALTAAYLNRMIGIQAPGARPVPVPTRDVSGALLRNGTAPADVYQRAGNAVWTALSNGVGLDQAVQQGRNRAEIMAKTDLQLANTFASRQVTSKSDHVVGYRRVLSGGVSCSLCVVASTQRYHDGDLLPIHPGCDCDVEPITGTEDPGRIIDQDALDSATEDIKSRLGVDTTDASQLRDLVIVHDHGEIGPVLGVRGQTFTGPDDIP